MPAFCLLDGFFEEQPPKNTAGNSNNDSEDAVEKKERRRCGGDRITVPINRIPATLGRTHITEEKNFFGLGKVKALSRQQCRIDVRAKDCCEHLVCSLGFAFQWPARVTRRRGPFNSRASPV